jgi:PIN domain nuclease of toxin-antitoxin system
MASRAAAALTDAGSFSGYSAILAAILGEAGGDTVFDKLEDATVSTVTVAEV